VVLLGLLLVLLKGPQPVLGAPPGRVRRVYRDDPQPCLVGHRGQPVPELCDRQPGNGGSELLSPPSPTHGLPARRTGIRKVEVLDGQCDTPPSLRGMNLDPPLK
jgi:hypothetical protein